MLSSELVEQYDVVRQQLLDLMQSMMQAEQLSSGVTLAIFDQLATEGKAIYFDNDGKWSSRTDMMGYEIAGTEDGLTLVLLEVADFLKMGAPDIDQYEYEDNQVESYDSAQQQFLSERGDEVLINLLSAMTQALTDYSDYKSE